MTSDLFKKGLEIRKAVLGDEFVDDSFANASDFSKPLQDLVTEFCFGAVWGREGLTKRDRSLINIALQWSVNLIITDSESQSRFRARRRSQAMVYHCQGLQRSHGLALRLPSGAAVCARRLRCSSST